MLYSFRLFKNRKEMEPVKNPTGPESIISQRHSIYPMKNERLKVEVTRIIRMIADRRSIPALILLLDDNEDDIRWIAAEGLIKIGRKSIVPLLRLIACGSSFSFLGHGAHHVLQNLLTRSEKRKLQNLLLSLENNPALAEGASTGASIALETIFRSYN